MNSTQMMESPIVRVPVRNFNCMVTFSPPRVMLQEAQQKFLDEFCNVAGKLPKGETPESILSRIECVLVPFWERRGTMKADWSATCIYKDQKAVNCPKCRGSGTVGRGRNQERCPVCRGSGTKINTHVKKHSEKGTAEVLVETEFTSNNGSNISFPIDQNPIVASQPLTDSQFQSFDCLTPKNWDRASEEKSFANMMFGKWAESIRENLSRYDEVDIFPGEIADETYLCVSAFLYPAYVCWYKSKGGVEFAVCNALTGAVSLPSRFSMQSDPRRNFQKLVEGFKKFVWSTVKVLLVFVIALIAIVIWSSH